MEDGSTFHLYGKVARQQGQYFSDLGIALALNVSVAELAVAQSLVVRHSFGGGTDGLFPSSGVIRDAQGNLYGTTLYGGVYSLGTVFKISGRGKETLLHSFAANFDGALSNWGLVRDSKGNLYGTTQAGGATTNDTGTVYKVDVTGKETVLYSFTGGSIGATDGAAPFGPPVRDLQGNLYGTTVQGGPNNFGTMSGLIQDSARNLHGTTELGGEYGWGTVYRLNAAGNETVLYSFTGGVDGKYAFGVLARDAAGNLYGTTQRGGNYGFGTVFKLKP